MHPVNVLLDLVFCMCPTDIDTLLEMEKVFPVRLPSSEE
jgi:hypothetical protein